LARRCFLRPWAEAALGILVLFGIFTPPALVAGRLLIAVLSFGSGLIQDWNAIGIQLLYAAAYALLLAFCRYNVISLDALLNRRRQQLTTAGTNLGTSER